MPVVYDKHVVFIFLDARPSVTHSPSMPATKIPTPTVLALFAAVSHEGVIVAPKDEAALRTRLIDLGFGVDCGRCYGSGNYGPQCVDGGRCWGCNGRRIVAPKLDRKLLARVQATVTPAILETLVQDRAAKIEAKRAAKGAADRVSAAYTTTLFMRTYYASGRFEGDYSPLAFAIHDNEKAPREALREATTSTAILAAEQAVLAARVAQDIALAAAIADGTVARSAAWHAALTAAKRYETAGVLPILDGREGVDAEQAEYDVTRTLAAGYLAAA